MTDSRKELQGSPRRCPWHRGEIPGSKLLGLTLIFLGIGVGLTFACADSPAVGPALDAPATAPQRLIALAPNLTEILFSLDLGDRVVGVGDYARWPPEVADLPRLGGLLNPNLELIVSLEPDLAVLYPSEGDVAGHLRSLGIDVLVVPIESIEDLLTGILATARRCGVEAIGHSLSEQLRQALEPEPSGIGRRVLLTAGRSPGRPAELLVAGPGTFLDELLKRLGAVNVFQDAKVLYPQVSLEEVLARKPDVILELRGEGMNAKDQELLRQDWMSFPEIPAVATGAVHVVAGDWTLVPGPRLPLLYQALAEALAEPRADGMPRTSERGPDPGNASAPTADFPLL